MMFSLSKPIVVVIGVTLFDPLSSPWCHCKISPMAVAAAFQPADISTPNPYRRQRQHQPLQQRSFQEEKENEAVASSSTASAMEEHRQQWIHKSLSYYSKVMREERRRNEGQVLSEEYSSDNYQKDFATLANKHYFAYKKIKNGQLQHAELIYRRILNDLIQEAKEEGDQQCSHAKLAVTTLLLALLTQRMGASPKQTRSVFLKFFRLVSMVDEHQQADSPGQHSGKIECACSAKVVGAYALFEMKQGNTRKSLLLAKKAFDLDPSGLRPLLHWKQFRDAAAAVASSKAAGMAVEKEQQQ